MVTKPLWHEDNIKKIQPKNVGKGIVEVCQGVYINIMGLFPPSWILWCLKHLLTFIICNLSSFHIWINLHVCPSFVFMTLHVLLLWKRPPNCKLQVPQALNPALACGHAVTVSLIPLNAPFLLTSPALWLFPLEHMRVLLRTRTECSDQASAPADATSVTTCDSSAVSHLTEEPLHFTRGGRGQRETGVQMLHLLTSKYNSEGVVCGPEWVPTDLAEGRSYLTLLLSHLPFLLPHLLQVFPESIMSLQINYSLHFSAVTVFVSPPHWNIRSREHELDLSCSLLPFCCLVLGR